MLKLSKLCDDCWVEHVLLRLRMVGGGDPSERPPPVRSRQRQASNRQGDQGGSCNEEATWAVQAHAWMAATRLLGCVSEYALPVRLGERRGEEPVEFASEDHLSVTH